MKDEFLGDAVARAAHAAQHDPRLDPSADAARERRPRAREGDCRDRAQCEGAGPADRGVARRQPHHIRNLQLDIKPVSVSSLLDAVASSVKPAADARSVGLLCDVDGGIGELQADGHRLQQVVWNLASNAIKFTPAGGYVILSARRDGAQLELSVIDTGEGIAADFLPHVFERFRQADGSEARLHGGLGLGLAIVRQIVELHGGTVRAESKGLGHGARFTVLLPMAASRPAAPLLPAVADGESPAPSSTDGTADLTGVRILLVDDEADGREMIAKMLESRGALVDSAASADEALSRLVGSAADVLISDIGMPRIRRLRADETRAAVAQAAACATFRRSR
jgi:two-component sensor histidine kinase